MPHLQIDLDRAAGLATHLVAWRNHVEAAIVTIQRAEALSGEPTNVVGRLDEIADDGVAMASSISSAIDTAQGFRIDLQTPASRHLDGWLRNALVDRGPSRGGGHPTAPTAASRGQTIAELGERLTERTAALEELRERTRNGDVPFNEGRLAAARSAVLAAERDLAAAIANDLTPLTAARINGLTQRLNSGDHPAQHAIVADLRNELDELGFTPASRHDVMTRILDGTPIELAFAELTGDWSAIPGGDPANYDEAERAVIAAMLGIEAGPAGHGGLTDLLDALPDRLAASLFSAGVGHQFAGSASIGTGGQLLAPVGASATRAIEGSVELSPAQIGVGFTQTHTVAITTQTTGAVTVHAGKNTLNRVYKWLRRFDRVPGPLQRVLDRSPLLRGIAKGLPFSVSYERFAGTELTYDATITAAQAAALDRGDTTVLPDLAVPETLVVGTSVLLRGGVIEGSSFAAKYKVAQVSETITDFDGLGFGVTRLDENRVAIYAGPIDALERQTRFGLPFAGLQNTTELADHDFVFAEVDLSTPDGLAAYETFTSSGIVPIASAPGVRPASVTLTTVDSDTALFIDVGFGSTDWHLGGFAGDYEIIDYADGTTEYTSTNSYGGSQVQTTGPLGPDNALDLAAAMTTIVVSSVDPSTASLLEFGYGHTPDPNGTVDTDHHVQLTFDHSDLAQIREQARQYVHTHAIDDDHFATLLEHPWPADVVSQIAATDNPAEVINVLDDLIDFAPHRTLEQLGALGFHLVVEPVGDEVGSVLPGSLDLVPAG